MNIPPDKLLDVLIEERKLVCEGRNLILRTLAGFNPLLMSVIVGATVAVITKGSGQLTLEQMAGIAFAGSQLGFILGAFYCMILTYLRIEGLYISRIEHQINAITNHENFICREILFTKYAKSNSGAPVFLGIFLSINVLYPMAAGLWSSTILKSPFAWCGNGVGERIPIFNQGMAGALEFRETGSGNEFQFSIKAWQGP